MNICSICKIPPIVVGPIPIFGFFHFSLLESMYEGVSVFLSASVTDMMELFLDDGKKIKHASFSEVTS